MRTIFFPILENERSYQLTSIFRSKRQGSLFAKINIPKAVCLLVEQKGFWPMHVSCKPWRPSNQEKNSVQHRDATTNKGEFPSRT